MNDLLSALDLFLNSPMKLVATEKTSETPNPDFNEIDLWIRSLPTLINEDKRRKELLLKKMTKATPLSMIQFIDLAFYHLILS